MIGFHGADEHSQWNMTIPSFFAVDQNHGAPVNILMTGVYGVYVFS
jgi:hypothetical protein